MYAAEWPCCHDPLRFSLGSDDLLPRATTLAQPTPASSLTSLCTPCASQAKHSGCANSINAKAERRPHPARISALCQASARQRLGKGGSLCVLHSSSSRTARQVVSSHLQIKASNRASSLSSILVRCPQSLHLHTPHTCLHLPQACAHMQLFDCMNAR